MIKKAKNTCEMTKAVLTIAIDARLAFSAAAQVGEQLEQMST